jgi:hypothetical protein
MTRTLYRSVGGRFGAAALGIAAVLALAACNGPIAVVSHTPTPQLQSPSSSPSPAPSPIISFEPPTPSPVIPTPLAQLLRCRLPVSNGQPGSGGFIVFPGGKFVADPASNVVVSGVPTPSPGPYGYQGNFYGLTYDRAYSKWLPVPATMVSPDGSRYVFPSAGSVYVLSAKGGPITELGADSGRGWNIFGVGTEGVYANPQAQGQQAVAGLWLLPFTGSPRQVTTSGYWFTVGRGAAYGYPAPAVPSGAVQSLLRLDLKTGASTVWLPDVPSNSSILGFDFQGNPIVMQQNNPPNLVVVTAPGQTVTLVDGSVQNFYVSWVLADSHGIWMASGDGTYLFRTGFGMEKVSDVTGPFAGPCA